MNYIYDVDVEVHSQEQPPIKPLVIFGNNVEVYDDEWRTHLHIVLTNRCNAKCDFCIEKDRLRTPDKKEALLLGVVQTLSEMKREGILKTVSITGGEPLLSPLLPAVVDIIRDFDPDIFLTMNTNGSRLLDQPVELLDKFNFINISRHYMDPFRNDLVFGIKTPSLADYSRLRQKLKRAQLRFQCVVNQETKLDDFMFAVRCGAVDDLSFRQLMITGEKNEDNIRKYRELVTAACERGTLIEQEIQDYYVYETHEVDCVPITFSYSNMVEAYKFDNEGDPDFVREFILTPDGILSSSWDQSIEKRILKRF